MKITTLLIIDGHRLIREALTSLLNADPSFRVIGDCGSAEEAFDFVRTFTPDIILLDVKLKGMDGVKATRQLRKLSPQSKILGFSMHTQGSYALKMIKNGASGYLTKSSSFEELIDAVKQVKNGKKYICREIAKDLTDGMLQNLQAGSTFGLSQRQLEIIALLKQGLSSKQIGAALGITSKTVEVHRYKILHKLKLKNTAALINFVNMNSEFIF